MAFKVDDIRKFKKYPGTFEKKSDTQYYFHFAKSDKSKIYKIFDDTRAVKDGSTGSWKWEGNNFKIGNSSWKPETLQTLNDTHKSKDEPKKEGGEIKPTPASPNPDDSKTQPEKPKVEIVPPTPIDWKKYEKVIPVTCYPDTSPNNFFKTHYQESYRDEATKRFLREYKKDFPNTWEFNGPLNNQCDEDTLMKMLYGNMIESSDGYKIHEMGAVNYLISSVIITEKGKITRGEEFFERDKLKFPNQINDNLKETVMKKLKIIKENKNIKESIVDKLSKIKTKKKINEVKTVRNLLKIYEDFENRNFKKYFRSMSQYVINSRLNESIDDTFKNAFSVVYSGLEDNFKEKYISNLLSKLNVESTSEIGETIKETLMSTPNDRVIEVFFDCNAVTDSIVSAIAPTIISEFPTNDGQDLLGIVQNVLTQKIQAQDTKETLKVKISQIVCPVLTNTMDNVKSLSKDMRNSIVPKLLDSNEL